jgi:hypothetical protein
MSLSSLNYPPLVSLAGMGLGVSFPVLEKLAKESPWIAVRLATAISYGMNVVAVSRPGRMDGEAVGDGELSTRRGKTLVAPSGWAFAIWGPIFLGELVSVTATFLIKESSSPMLVALLRETAGPFVAAQLFQTLWCAAFRPKYKGAAGFINTGLLSATAYSLSRAHAMFVAQPQLYSNLNYAIFFLPMSLHFGWTVAASLVSLNGAISMQKNSSKQLIAYAGHVSVVAATGLGIFITVTRSAPVFGGVIAWALTAVADGMKQRLAAACVEEGEVESERKPNMRKKEVEEVKKAIINTDGVATQLLLSRIGAAMNGVAVAFIAGTMALGISSGKSTPVP